jgi:hypothetical protein
MLIWQAISNDYLPVSVDGHVKKYSSEGLRIKKTGSNDTISVSLQVLKSARFLACAHNF